MELIKKLAIVVSTILLVSALVAMASDESEAASDYTARVFIGDGTEEGTTEYSGSGSSVESILLDALSAHDLVINPNGTVHSMDGISNSDTNSWNIFQWRPPTGWVSVLASNSGNAYLESGTSYYVFYSETTQTGTTTTYSTPSSFEPTATAYFYIKFMEDYNANSYVTSVLTEEERRNGFWISGTGSDVAAAFMDACSSLRALGNSGFELVINDDRSDDLYGWLGSFMGLGDVQMTGGLWKYWSQFAWDEDTSSWTYNQWCLGYYDPGVNPYFTLVRQITEDDDAPSGVDVTPSDLPSEVVRGRCTVTFVDGDGQVMKTQTVSYFGSATAPSNPTKSPSGGVTYEFTGWDRSFDQVISNITVTAQFTAVSSGGNEPENIDVTGVSISTGALQMSVGETYRLTATVRPSNATDKDVTWTTNDPSVITVDQNGNITAVSAGTATVTVTTKDGGYTGTCTVTVTSEVPVSSIALGFDLYVMSIGSAETLEVVIGPDDAADKSVFWLSSDMSVVTVNGNGLVTAVGAGTATVTVTANSGGLSASCTITVLDAEEPGSASVTVSSEDGGSSTATVNVSQAPAGAGLDVNTPLGSVSLTGDAVVASTDGDGTITVTVSVIDEDGLGDAQRTLIESLSSDVVIYEYLINNGSVSSLGGTATISMPYSLSQGEDRSSIHVYCLYADGSLERFSCEYSDGYVTFETTHLSLYFATSEDVSAGSGGSDDGDDSDDDGGSNTMLYIGLAVVVIVIVAIAAIALTRRHA